MREYQRLSLQDREEISRNIAAGIGIRAIGRKLGRHCSTITRTCPQTAKGDSDFYSAFDGLPRPINFKLTPSFLSMLSMNLALPSALLIFVAVLISCTNSASSFS